MTDNNNTDKQPLAKRRMLISINRILHHDHLLLAGMSLTVGLITGIAVIFFRETIQGIQWLYFGTSTLRFYLAVESFPWWITLFVPAIGGLVVGLLVRWTMPKQRPQGVPDVIEAYILHNAYMPLRTGIAAMLASAASIGAGASVGREGPAVHLGATLSSWLTRTMSLPQSYTRLILGCGVSAAVAASFNAPIAGALFASEVVIGYYALQTLAPIVIASVMATALTRAFYGNFPAFVVSDTLFASFWEFPAFIILGVVCGITAMIFMRSIEISGSIANKLPGPTWYRPMLAGFMVGGIALIFPHVMGVGYGVTESTMTMQFGFWLLVGIALAKILATALSIGFGFSGGVFSPALVIGALTGCAFGIVTTAILPQLSSGPEAYALVGMGAVSAAVLGAPISTILIVFELTGDYALTLGVMVAVVTSTEISQLFYGRSFFSRVLSRQGVKLQSDDGAYALKTNHVSHTMRTDNPSVLKTSPIQSVRTALQASLDGKVFVVDRAGVFIGSVELGDLKGMAFDQSNDDGHSAETITNTDAPMVSLNDDLNIALDLMNKTGEDNIAVVDTLEDKNFKGSINHHDVMQIYTQALIQFRNEDRKK